MEIDEMEIEHQTEQLVQELPVRQRPCCPLGKSIPELRYPA